MGKSSASAIANGFSAAGKRSLVALALLIVVIQFLQLFEPFRWGWPFSHYQLFTYSEPAPTFERTMSCATLKDSAGNNYFVLGIGALIPVESFLAVRIIGKYLKQPVDPSALDVFSRFILTNLNEHPWRDHPGLGPPPRPQGRFEQIAWMKCRIEVRLRKEPVGLSVLHKRLVRVYQLPRQSSETHVAN